MLLVKSLNKYIKTYLVLTLSSICLFYISIVIYFGFIWDAQIEYGLFLGSFHALYANIIALVLIYFFYLIITRIASGYMALKISVCLVFLFVAFCYVGMQYFLGHSGMVSILLLMIIYYNVLKYLWIKN